MAKPSIKSNLIDGTSTKRFKNIEAAAEWVRTMEDFGEDGRRSWGVQGEFGTHEFVGFTWADVTAAWKANVEVEVHEHEAGAGAEWVFEFGESVQLWARRFAILINGTFEHSETGEMLPCVETFDVLACQGRYKVDFIAWAGPDDCDRQTIGTYRSMEAAVDACRRFYAAAKSESSFVAESF